MTQERKDELYDQMIAWICEHIPNDEDLFLTLHGHFGMTKDELHDHSIESLDRFFPRGICPVSSQAEDQRKLCGIQGTLVADVAC